jgi:NAD dependent epimerase/dehydratase family enzyme
VKAWEKALDEAKTPRTRKVKMRTAVVMNAGDGGAFDIYLRLVRLGLGGRHGDGRQYISWIHQRDFLRAVHWLIDHRYTDGIVNIASPNPLTNTLFLRQLREAWGTPVGLPSTRTMLAIGSMILRNETELVLKSRRVVPARLLDSGFRFEFPVWDDAARDLCARWRQR